MNNIKNLFNTGFERFKALDANQQKGVIFGLVITIALIFVFMPSFSFHTHTVNASGGGLKPTHYRIQEPVNTVPVKPITLPPAPLAPTYDGKWVGKGIIKGWGLCEFGLEVRPSGPNFSGFTSLACVPLTDAQQLNARPVLPAHGNAQGNLGLALITGKLAPMSAILVSNEDAGTLKLHTDDATDAEACNLSDLTIRNFGQQRIMVDLQGSFCAKGSMVMQKVGA